jgi:hypothetical protein
MNPPATLQASHGAPSISDRDRQFIFVVIIRKRMIQ